MTTIMRSGESKRKIAALAALAVGVIALLVVPVQTVSSPRSTGSQTGLTCEACDHQWVAPMRGVPTCPQCGGRPILKSSYCCPKCRHEFVGIERQKMDVGKFRYRFAGTTEWLGSKPSPLTCPNCEYSSPDIEQNAIPSIKTDKAKPRVKIPS
ncbi:MAG: hypothetical protein GY794_01260 [bacterium]|nr:hypothetical protein [bacterium]